MGARDEIPEEYFEWLRLTDPEAAQRLEDALRGHEEDVRLAAIAELDLRAALASMALDVFRGRGAFEHIENVIKDALASLARNEAPGQINFQAAIKLRSM
jgi:hypothetical protein